MNRDKEFIKRLIERCIQRDPRAWDKFIKIINPFIAYIIKDKFRRLGFNHQKSDMENLRQEIFLSLWEDNKLRAIKDKDKVIPWIYALSVNRASNYIRKIRSSAPVRAYDLTDSAKTPIEQLLNKELGNAIEGALKTLNHKENIIIKLSLLYGKKCREISQILNIPIGTVLSHAKRARLKLKKKLKKYKKNMQ